MGIKVWNSNIGRGISSNEINKMNMADGLLW